MSQEILNVEGMNCGHCRSAVGSALDSIDGIISTDVNPENGQVSARYDDSKVAASQMKNAIKNQGYDVAQLDNIQHRQHQIKKPN